MLSGSNITGLRPEVLTPVAPGPAARDFFIRCFLFFVHGQFTLARSDFRTDAFRHLAKEL